MRKAETCRKVDPKRLAVPILDLLAWLDLSLKPVPMTRRGTTGSALASRSAPPWHHRNALRQILGHAQGRSMPVSGSEVSRRLHSEPLEVHDSRRVSVWKCPTLAPPWNGLRQILRHAQSRNMPESGPEAFRRLHSEPLKVHDSRRVSV